MVSIMQVPKPAVIRANEGRLNRIEVIIIVAHSLLAGVFTVIGLASANDPGFGDLARIVIIMLAGAWVVGIVATALLARRFSNQALRYAILVLGPLTGIAVIIGQARMG